MEKDNILKTIESALKTATERRQNIDVPIFTDEYKEQYQYYLGKEVAYNECKHLIESLTNNTMED